MSEVQGDSRRLREFLPGTIETSDETYLTACARFNLDSFLGSSQAGVKGSQGLG